MHAKIKNPQGTLNQINKTGNHYQIHLKISKGEIQEFLAKITDLLIINVKYARDM